VIYNKDWNLFRLSRFHRFSFQETSLQQYSETIIQITQKLLSRDENEFGQIVAQFQILEGLRVESG